MSLNDPLITPDMMSVFKDRNSAGSDDVLLTLEVYKVDVRYRINNLDVGKASNIDPLEELQRKKPPKRKNVTYYSRKSKRNFKHNLVNARCTWTHEFTLKYPSEYPLNGRIVKRHLKKFLEALQREYPGINWAWRLGFQERGAPHLHGLSDRFIDYRWLREIWARIVDSPDPSHLKAGTHIDKIRNVGKFINYMVNYLANDKDSETLVPAGFENVGRFWGIKRGIVEKELIQDILPPDAASQKMRIVKRWYKAEVRGWAENRVKKGGSYFKWKLRPGVGFTAINGRRIVDDLIRRGMLIL